MEGSTEDGTSREELFAEARRLEAEASRPPGQSAEDRRRRAEAAELRRRALGERIYPVLTCSSCSRLTGWLDGDGLCDACSRQARLDAVYADPRSGWILPPVRRRPFQQDPDPALRARLAAAVGLRGGYRRAVARAWRVRVEPDETGPVESELGFELEVAHREEDFAADSSGIVVRFLTATHRFDGDSWVRLDTSRVEYGDTLTPKEFSAALPIEELAEAWGDFRAEVVTLNREAWERESNRRETERQEREAREEMLREQRGAWEEALLEQRGTAGLLDEGGARER